MTIPFTTPITSVEEGKSFLDALVAEGKMFHLEDDFRDIPSGQGNLFTEEECASLDMRIPELYALEWAEYDCPIGYVLAKETEGEDL